MQQQQQQLQQLQQQQQQQQQQLLLLQQQQQQQGGKSAQAAHVLQPFDEFDRRRGGGCESDAKRKTNEVKKSTNNIS